MTAAVCDATIANIVLTLFLEQRLLIQQAAGCKTEAKIMKEEANGRLVKQVFTERIVGKMPRGRLNLFSRLNIILTFCTLLK